MSTEKKQLHVNLFEMACVVHHSTGMWAEPGDQRSRIADLGFWTELAQLLEYGTFDCLFLADVLGAYDHNGLPDELISGHQIPTLDPLSLIPAMAAVTSGLGFGATFSTTYEPPFAFARRASTIDFITKGRFAWNIVTSYLTNAAQNFGLEGQIAHDDRYHIADEYLDVLYKLWEGSWDDDALVLDRKTRTVSDPAKVRYIDHVGQHYRVKGPHLTHASPQRTPFLFQATRSNAGKEFAARHSEALFTGAAGESGKASLADLRARLVRHGRRPDDIKIFSGAAIVTGRNDVEVANKEELFRRVSWETSRLHPDRLGIDLTRFNPTDTVASLIANKAEGWERLQQVTRMRQEETTVADLIERQKNGGRDPRREGRGERDRFYVAGSPKVCADAIEKWLDEDGIDGINLRQFSSFGTVRDFIELVVPELRSRGRYREAYTPGETLRERVFGAGRARLPDYHYAARYREPAKLKEPRPPLVFPELSPEELARDARRRPGDHNRTATAAVTPPSAAPVPAPAPVLVTA